MEYKTYLTHDEMCELLNAPKGTGLKDIEAIYRPDAEMWLLKGDSYDPEDDKEIGVSI